MQQTMPPRARPRTGGYEAEKGAVVEVGGMSEKIHSIIRQEVKEGPAHRCVKLRRRREMCQKPENTR